MTDSFENTRYFHFTVTWYGNRQNKQLTTKILKEVQKTIDKIADEHRRVLEISKVSKVKSSRGYL